MKIKINNKIQHESYSIEDVLEPKLLKKGKTFRIANEKQFEIIYNMKKSPNYFLDFLQYLNKKKKVKFKPMGKQSLFLQTDARQSIFGKKASFAPKRGSKHSSIKKKIKKGNREKENG